MPNQIQNLQYRPEMNSKSKTPETKFHGGMKRFQIINTNSPLNTTFAIFIKLNQQQAIILI